MVYNQSGFWIPRQAESAEESAGRVSESYTEKAERRRVREKRRREKEKGKGRSQKWKKKGRMEDPNRRIHRERQPKNQSPKRIE